jgi:uncharacterized protein DUF2442
MGLCVCAKTMASRERKFRASRRPWRNIWRSSVEPGRGYMISREEFERANRRGTGSRSAMAVAARYDRRLGRVVIRLNSGLDVAFSPRDAQGLEKATTSQLSEIEISPSGFGIYFPRLDADICLPALLQGFLGSRAWMAAQLGAIGGKTRSAAKLSAARRNGKLGGRPKVIRDRAERQRGC